VNDDKGFIWAELHESDASVEFIKLATKTMEQYTYDLSAASSSPPKDQLVDYLRQQSDPSKIVRLHLKGQITQEQYRQLKFNEVYEATRDMFFHLDIRHNELDVEGFGRVFLERVDNPIEAYGKRLDILIAQAETEEKRQQLEQAKELGLKYLEESRA
jgi:hypothetical protein